MGTQLEEDHKLMVLLSNVIDDVTDKGIVASLTIEEINKQVSTELKNFLDDGGYSNIKFDALPVSLTKPDVVTYHFMDNGREFGRAVLGLKERGD